jgi:putative FmdB family regulatory protein
MPIYEYRCRACGHRYSRLSRAIISGSEETPPPCPECASEDTARAVSAFAAGGPGGPDAAEKAHQQAQDSRAASITPKGQIEQWRKA